MLNVSLRNFQMIWLVSMDALSDSINATSVPIADIHQQEETGPQHM